MTDSERQQAPADLLNAGRKREALGMLDRQVNERGVS
jgi:hypothetical protein